MENEPKFEQQPVPMENRGDDERFFNAADFLETPQQGSFLETLKAFLNWFKG